jgi:hypothetical protein
MKHVDENVECDGNYLHSTQMMASMLDLTKSTYEWSNCSVIELNRFLRTERASCLFNEPIVVNLNSDKNNKRNNFQFKDTHEQFSDEIKLKAILPGELMLYEIKKQCQQIFGPSSDACEQNVVKQLKQ